MAKQTLRGAPFPASEVRGALSVMCGTNTFIGTNDEIGDLVEGLSDALKQTSDGAEREGNFAVLPARANIFAHAAKAAAKHERLVHDQELRRERV